MKAGVSKGEMHVERGWGQVVRGGHREDLASPPSEMEPQDGAQQRRAVASLRCSWGPWAVCEGQTTEEEGGVGGQEGDKSGQGQGS